KAEKGLLLCKTCNGTSEHNKSAAQAQKAERSKNQADKSRTYGKISRTSCYSYIFRIVVAIPK
ncbi:MAG: hypothetical protein ACI4HN_05320, partial [Ruminococcus sp.]